MCLCIGRCMYVYGGVGKSMCVHAHVNVFEEKKHYIKKSSIKNSKKENLALAYK